MLIFFSASPLFSQKPSSAYDPSLADSLGADSYGMRMYTFAIFKTRSVQIANKDSLQKLMRGHLDTISRLAKSGKILLAGPYGKNDLDYRGLFVFNSADTLEIRNLLNSDPAIRIGVFNPIFIPWYGSAAIPMYMPFHSLVEKEKS